MKCVWCGAKGRWLVLGTDWQCDECGAETGVVDVVFVGWLFWYRLPGMPNPKLVPKGCLFISAIEEAL